ncbi:MAG TPA: hypothetical protein VGG25_16505 [Streptosporangiaceae bacterium]
MTALFFGSGHAEWLARLREFGEEIVPVVKRKHLARYAGISPLHTVTDLASVDEVLAAGLRLAVEHHASRVLTLTEAAIVPVAVLRESLALPGQPVAQALRFTNKYLMKQCLSRSGIPVTPFRLAAPPATAMASLGMPPPYMVKPVTGAGSVQVRRVPGQAQWDDWSCGRDGHPGLFLVERLVEMNAELHVDAVVAGGRVLFSCVSQYTRPLLELSGEIAGSYVLPETDPRVTPARDLHGQVIEALGLEDGVTHLELFDTPAGMLVSEIASRPAGGGITGAVELARGVDLVLAALALHLGAPLDLAPCAARQTLAGWLGLPARPGTVRELTPADELAKLPGVVTATSHYAAGDVITGQTTSTFHACTLLFEVEDGQALSELQRAAGAAYRLAVT